MGTTLGQSERLGGQGLVSAYIQHIGEREPKWHRYNSTPGLSIRHASFLIARSCVLLVSGDDKPADRVLRNVRDETRQATQLSLQKFDDRISYSTHLFHLATMLLERDKQIDAALSFQSKTHKQTVKDLALVEKALSQAKGGRIGDLIGQRAELQTLGLMSYPQDPDSLAIRALVHHDKGTTRAKNYDLVLVSAGANPTNIPILSSNQVKSECLDFCEGKEGVTRGEEVRAEYGEHITLIAGHCDVHGGQEGTMSEWLDAALRGKASPDILDTLNSRAERLRAAIINPEPWRKGMLPPGT